MEKLENIPRHIAIIPDGNRRWAKERGLPQLEGHRKGALNFEKLIKKAREMGIQYFTGWAFSTENWKRSKEENTYLFELLRNFSKRYKDQFTKEKVRFIHLGRKDRISEDIRSLLEDLEETTKSFTEFTVGVALDYGGHDELIRAFKEIANKGLEITPENIEAHLDTRDMPMPDLIIRPGFEQRLSGFMSWQSAYAELYFPQVYFPDFGPEELEKAIRDYARRERRFGGDSKKY